MKIVPAAKGFISGPIAFRFVDDGDSSSQSVGNQDWVNCEDGGASLDRQLISSQWTHFTRFGDQDQSLQIVSTRQGLQLEQLRFLIVVEKEGIFHRLPVYSLIDLQVRPQHSGDWLPGLRYESLCQQNFSRLSGLCDYNSYGLSLLLTYRFPTMSSEFEGQDMQVPNMNKHVDEFAEKCNAQADGRDEFSAALQKMTAHDHRETSRLVARFQSINLLPEYAEEIEAMRDGGVKCELESVFIFGFGFLISFLERCLLIQDYI
eukprot:gene28413-37349_t